MDNKTCDRCGSKNVEGNDWFDEGDQITRTEWVCDDCEHIWTEPPFVDEEHDSSEWLW